MLVEKVEIKIRFSHIVVVRKSIFVGYTPNLAVKLIQKHDIEPRIASRLVQAFGGRADVSYADKLVICVQSVCQFAIILQDAILMAKLEEEDSKFDVIAPGYPFTEAEILYSIRHEWAVKAEDILARRTRLAFLNKTSALSAIPKVVDIMGRELSWSSSRKDQEIRDCTEAINWSFVGNDNSSI